ncbi:transposase [Mesorhizobium captivum]|uniref:transposase n=1 Tax=Mesorhizobium captivum TaxID=3072319 RepID=UPI003D310DCD
MDLATVREETAYGWFRKVRWPETDGEPYCPKCGTLRCHAMSRGRFKCSDRVCKAVFTVPTRPKMGPTPTRSKPSSRASSGPMSASHRFSLKYFDWYVAELAWREDTRYHGARRSASCEPRCRGRPPGSSAATGRATNRQT